MRTGSCGVQQTLTPEAATIVKQAVVLARQRGHAQVTPLHVANTMLAASNGLLRQACIKSHTHPFQCRALELCFNVALNRLQAASSSTTTTTILDLHSQNPSISNALIAAFKRAQAHQKRGTIENQQQQQQQALLSVKIELDQLIISILDDPSVSRVMREAGFSSIKVKNNLEKSISLQLVPQTPIPNPKQKTLFSSKNEDVIRVMQSLMNKKKKSIIIVGERIESVESVVKDVIDYHKVGNGDNVILEALKEVKFINFELFTFANLQREEVERKIRELKSLIKRLLINGVVLYIGDLKWISDYRGEKRRNFYCSVEHMIMEIGRLVYEFAENGGFRVLGIATFETYMRCKSSGTGHHSLESVWGLHPVTLVDQGSLGLSLIHESDNQVESRNKKDENGNNQEKQLPYCTDCSTKFEDEARNLQMKRCNNNSESTLSSLPPWLKDECRRSSNSDEESCSTLKELQEKWISICNATHKKSKTPSPSSSPNSYFSYDQQFHNFHQNHLLSSSSSDQTMENMEYIPKFKEFDSLNLNTLCNALEKKVPWQKRIIPEIAGTILQCRSGMLKRKEYPKNGDCVKQETWLFFNGRDSLAKDEIARELARVVYGSYTNFVSISLSNFSPKRVESSEELRSKRSRDEENCTNYIERFSQAVANNPHRVFVIEDFDKVDCSYQKEIKRVIENGKFVNFGGEEINLCDAIVILMSCDDDFNFRSHSMKKKTLNGSNEEACKISLDLNLYFSNESIENHVNDEIGLVENVDKRVVFNIVGK